jgi:hypothetical protein
MAAGITLGAWQAASAADMPVKAPALKPAYNWTGFYFGGHFGYGWDNASAGIASDAPLLAALMTVGSIPSSLATDPKGLLAGL